MKFKKLYLFTLIALAAGILLFACESFKANNPEKPQPGKARSTSANTASTDAIETNTSASSTVDVSVIPAQAADDPGYTPEDNCTKWHPGHYIFIGRTRTYDALWTNPTIRKNFLGIQMKFEWGPLEPKEGGYNFSDIDNTIAYFKKMNAQYGVTKRLVIQMGDKLFGEKEYAGPAYMSFNGGNPKYEGGYFKQDDRGGWAVKTWIPAVNQRWQMLISELGKRYDGEPLVEAVVFSETIVHKGIPGANPHSSYGGMLSQSGYDMHNYLQVIESNLVVAKRVFPHTVVMQYMNKFINDNGRKTEESPELLQQLGDFLVKNGIGTGGPDLQAPGKEGAHSEAFNVFYKNLNKIPLGVAAQPEEYQQPAYTAQKLFDFGVGDSTNTGTVPDNQALHLNYVFWTKDDNSGQVIQFTRDVVPTVNSKAARINKRFPSALAATSKPCTD